ncbi:MAG: phosphoribosylformylglycinamidine synthase, partial [Ruminococcaceae bacterium]|nr:phosphoribosylformylglycinamidine synthase [Oscillospiraceae bacterium]
MSVYRVYAEKKPGFDAAAQGVLSDLKTALHIDALKGVRLLNRYDVEGISREVFERALNIVFSEPQADTVTFTLDAGEDRVFAVEYLPGQFDQRADSCEQCIQLMAGGERPRVRTARCYLLQGKLTDEEFAKIKAYLINPVEAREATLAECDTLASVYEVPGETAVLTGFCQLSEEELAKMVAEYGLAMDRDDLAFLQAYFRDTEKRDPFITELRIIDTYWSDHCRHTTFGTHITSVELPEGDSPLKKGYEEYLAIRKELYGENTTRPITLMDAATIGAKYQKRKGILKNLDESEEINACSVKVQVKDEEG